MTGVYYVLRLSVKSWRAPVLGLARADGRRRNCRGSEDSGERREDTLRQHDGRGRVEESYKERGKARISRVVKFSYVGGARKGTRAPRLAPTPDSEDERQGLGKAD